MAKGSGASQEPHILTGVDEALTKLRSSLQEMGGAVEGQFEVVEAMVRGDTGRGEELLASEKRIDRMEVELIYDCTSFIMRYSPLGRDLRIATRCIRQAADIERMGDEIQHVGDLLGDPQMGLQAGDEWGEEMRALLALTRRALQRSLKALRDGDIKLARKVVRGDRDINAAHEQCDALALGGLGEGRYDGEGLIARHRVGRSLERIGDHAKNLCQEMAVAMRGEELALARKPTKPGE